MLFDLIEGLTLVEFIDILGWATLAASFAAILRKDLLYLNVFILCTSVLWGVHALLIDSLFMAVLQGIIGLLTIKRLKGIKANPKLLNEGYWVSDIKLTQQSEGKGNDPNFRYKQPEMRESEGKDVEDKKENDGKCKKE